MGVRKFEMSGEKVLNFWYVSHFFIPFFCKATGPQTSWGWKASLKIIWSKSRPTPLLKAGSATASCWGMCPFGFGYLRGGESSLSRHPVPFFDYTHSNFFFLCLNGISCISAVAVQRWNRGCWCCFYHYETFVRQKTANKKCIQGKGRIWHTADHHMSVSCASTVYITWVLHSAIFPQVVCKCSQLTL